MKLRVDGLVFRVQCVSVFLLSECDSLTISPAVSYLYIDHLRPQKAMVKPEERRGEGVFYFEGEVL